ncbi:MAG: Arm DNA-binding domain-containing protein [Sphingorhabdus sp.]
MTSISDGISILKAGPHVLTDVALRNTKPKPQNYKITDHDDLYVLVSTSGGKRWRFDYRFCTKRRTLALGRYSYTRSNGGA